jgi:hypothetical protein
MRAILSVWPGSLRRDTLYGPAVRFHDAPAGVISCERDPRGRGQARVELAIGLTCCVFGPAEVQIERRHDKKGEQRGGDETA